MKKAMRCVFCAYFAWHGKRKAWVSGLTPIAFGTPMIYEFKEDITDEICTGDWIRVDTDKGGVEVIKKGT